MNELLKKKHEWYWCICTDELTNKWLPKSLYLIISQIKVLPPTICKQKKNCDLEVWVFVESPGPQRLVVVHWLISCPQCQETPHDTKHIFKRSKIQPNWNEWTSGQDQNWSQSFFPPIRRVNRDCQLQWLRG